MIHSILNIPVCNISNLGLFMALLIPFILGYTLKYFLNEKHRKAYTELENTRLDFIRSESRYASIKAELELAQGELKNLKEEDLPGLKNKFKDLENQNSILGQGLEKAHSELKSFSGQNLASLQQQLSSLHEEHEKLKGTYSQLLMEKENVNLSNTSSIPGSAETGQSTNFGALSLDLENLKKEAEEAKASHAQELHMANEAISSHLQEIEKWRNQAENSHSQHQFAQNSLQECMGQQEHLKNELFEIHENLKSAESDLESFRSSHPGLLLETESLRNKLDSALSESEATKSQIKDLENKVGDHAQTIQFFHEKLESSENEKLGLQASIQSFGLDKIHSESLMGEISQLKQKLANLEHENATLKASLSRHLGDLEVGNQIQENLADQHRQSPDEFPNSGIVNVHEESPKLEEGHRPEEGHSHGEGNTYGEGNTHEEGHNHGAGHNHGEGHNHEEGHNHGEGLTHEEGHNHGEGLTHEEGHTNIVGYTHHEGQTHEEGHTPLSEHTPGEKSPTHFEPSAFIHTQEEFQTPTESGTPNHYQANAEHHSSEHHTPEEFHASSDMFHSPEHQSPEHHSSEHHTPEEFHASSDMFHSPEHQSPELHSPEHHSPEEFHTPSDLSVPRIVPTIEGTHNHGEDFKAEETHTSMTEQTRNSNIYNDPNYYFKLKGYENAHHVFLVGDFENWDQNHYEMHFQDEEWVFPIHLDPGKYLYKFIVDGNWILDPAHNYQEENDYGTGNSVVMIG